MRDDRPRDALGLAPQDAAERRAGQERPAMRGIDPHGVIEARGDGLFRVVGEE